MKRKIFIFSTILTSLSITGISFVDNLIWDKLLAVSAIIAFSFVGILYSLHLLSGRNSGRYAYLATFLVLLIADYFIYKGICNVQSWIMSWDIWIRILVAIGIGVTFIGIASYCIYDYFENEDRYAY